MGDFRCWLPRFSFRRWVQIAAFAVIICSAAVAIRRCPTQRGEKGAPVLVLREPYVGIIFPPNTWIEDRYTVWEPAPQDVERAERRIHEFLSWEKPGIADHLNEYVGQYFGIIVGGHRILYCSFFHRTTEAADVPTHGLDSYLRNMGAPYMVVDGGEHYFQLQYDPETDRCSDLHVNGVS
jgi:hypothetical protein